MRRTQKLTADFIIKAGAIALSNNYARENILKLMEWKIYKDLIIGNPDNRPKRVQMDKYYMGRALLHSINRAFKRGHLSRKSAEGLFKVFLGNVFFGGFYKRRLYMEKYGRRPPMFITISPTWACNLHCKGCYAAASEKRANHLEFDIFDRIIREAKDLWGSNFFVISGGEPLLYRSQGKTFLDIAEKHSDCYFLMYTNATLIDKKMAKRLSELGNITPAVSVEGFKKETDERRGKGVFEKIMSAMEYMREEGVPFGISYTAYRENADILLRDDFWDFYFEEQGAIYAWVFHYMPIGREYTLSMLPTPEQRLKLFNHIWRLVREKRYFIADFWNSGTASDGCISGARACGYFHINWDADVMPCVFIPYSVTNLKELYKNGGNLDDAINTPLFQEIRKWQDEYYYAKPPDKAGNLLRQCIIRDHYAKIYEIIKKTGARGIYKEAEDALQDEEYRKGLIEYGEIIGKMTEEYWKKVYLGNEK